MMQVTVLVFLSCRCAGPEQNHCTVCADAARLVEPLRPVELVHDRRAAKASTCKCIDGATRARRHKHILGVTIWDKEKCYCANRDSGLASIAEVPEENPHGGKVCVPGCPAESAKVRNRCIPDEAIATVRLMQTWEVTNGMCKQVNGEESYEVSFKGERGCLPVAFADLVYHNKRYATRVVVNGNAWILVE